MSGLLDAARRAELGTVVELLMLCWGHGLQRDTTFTVYNLVRNNPLIRVSKATLILSAFANPAVSVLTP